MANQLPKGWKVLFSEYLHREPWLTVRRDEIQYPDGYVNKKYFVLEYPDWVNVLAITKEGDFLLVRQYRHGMGKTSFEIVAGACDKRDKSPLETAKRELMEETGYGGGHWQEWMTIAPNPSTSNNYVHCFLATDLEKITAPNPDPGEEISTHLFSFAEVKEMMQNGAIIQATHLAPLWKYIAMQLKPVV